MRYLCICIVSVIFVIGCDDGGSDSSKSGPDTTAPSVVSTTPADNAINIAATASVIINFSETMNISSVEGVVVFSPAVTGASYAWTNGDSTLTISHDSFVSDGTEYTVTIGTGAEDLSGNALATVYEFSFTVTDSSAPGDVEDLIATAAGGGSVSLSWTEPADSDFDHVLISWLPADGAGSATVDAGTTTGNATGLTTGTEYTILARAVDEDGNMSSGVSIEITPPAASVPVHYIYTAEQLNAVRGGVTGYLDWGLDDYYILMDDIELDLYTTDWAPIGAYTNEFTGTFDGNGHVISDLVISSTTYYTGLFGAASNAVIKNLGIEDADVTCSDVEAAGLIGHAEGCTVSNCYVTGEISGTGYAGGLVGTADNSTLNGCHAAVTVTGSVEEQDGTGGLAGSISDSTLTDCYSTGTVVNNDNGWIGGLIGYASGISATGCYSSCSVSSTDTAGGLIGRLEGSSTTLDDCYATGSVTATGANVGGLIGYYSASGGSITGCYATGAVSGGGDTGGLVGDCANGNISDSYATGNVTSTGNHSGGMVGYNYSGSARTFSNCYATGSVTGTWYVGGLIGTNNWAITGCYATGNITMSTDDNDVISVGGLVGYNHAGGSIETSYASGNITITGSSVLNAASIGGLIGESYGDGDSETISQCFASGDVTVTLTGMGGAQMIGGLIGRNQERSIVNCFSTGNVTAENSNDEYAGGLIGSNIYSTVAFSIINCYQSGVILCSNSEGGLFGANTPTGITITSCYYNDDDNDDSYGTGLTLAEMLVQSNFTGWDFVGETANGTDDYWTIDGTGTINSGYPYLQGMEP